MAATTVPPGRRIAAWLGPARDGLSRRVSPWPAPLNVDELPVVRNETPDEIVSVISRRVIVNDYYTKTGA